MKDITQSKIALVLIIVVIFLIYLGIKRINNTDPVYEAGKDRGSTTPSVKITTNVNITQATPDQFRAISGGMLHNTDIKKLYSVKWNNPNLSTDYYIVGAEIDGPGLEGPGDVGLWIVQGKSPGFVNSLDAVTKGFSVYPLKRWSVGGLDIEMSKYISNK